MIKMSEKQIKANIENAQKSTGPKDTSKTRFNPLKHGLLSKEIWSIISKEERVLLNELHEEILNEISP